MPENATNPARGGETGSGKCSLAGAVNSPTNTQKPPHVQEAIVELTRAFIGEALRIAAIKASHGADNVLLADDVNATRDIDIAIQNLREAGRAFRELQLLLKEESGQ